MNLSSGFKPIGLFWYPDSARQKDVTNRARVTRKMGVATREEGGRGNLDIKAESKDVIMEVYVFG